MFAFLFVAYVTSHCGLGCLWMWKSYECEKSLNVKKESEKGCAAKRVCPLKCWNTGGCADGILVELSVVIERIFCRYTLCYILYSCRFCRLKLAVTMAPYVTIVSHDLHPFKHFTRHVHKNSLRLSNNFDCCAKIYAQSFAGEWGKHRLYTSWACEWNLLMNFYHCFTTTSAIQFSSGGSIGRKGGRKRRTSGLEPKRFLLPECSRPVSSSGTCCKLAVKSVAAHSFTLKSPKLSSAATSPTTSSFKPSVTSSFVTSPLTPSLRSPVTSSLRSPLTSSSTSSPISSSASPLVFFAAQPTGQPEIVRLTTDRSPACGGGITYVLGKHFTRPVVTFSRKGPLSGNVSTCTTVSAVQQVASAAASLGVNAIPMTQTPKG